MKITVKSYERIGQYEYAETERTTFFGRRIRETWFVDTYRSFLWRSEDTGALAPPDVNALLRNIEEVFAFKRAKEKAEAGK